VEGLGCARSELFMGDLERGIHHVLLPLHETVLIHLKGNVDVLLVMATGMMLQAYAVNCLQQLLFDIAFPIEQKQHREQ
jgi:hypothetical protein